jgi:UDP-N-acetylglucosamine 2-epimerase (non-hydrolysing)
MAARSTPYVHIIVIGTKPDIIKQAPIYHELKRRGEPVLLCHTDQHYDHAYSGGMLAEFGITPDVHLGATGTPQQQTATIIAKFADLLAMHIVDGRTPIPYIHGDTMTSMAVGVSSYLQGVACVHVEAGIRTLTPKREVYQRFLDDFRETGVLAWEAYRAAMRDPANFDRESREPFPEQFNTRVSDAATGYHAAPVELDRGFLLDEGFPADTIEVVGNTVVDAMASARAEAAQATIFETYPQLAQQPFIRICIHRRENTTDRTRFLVLFDALEKLVRGGRHVLLISLSGTERALDDFDLRDRLAALRADYPVSFIYSTIWTNYRDVIAAMLRCAVVATDSGSMQEEMNFLRVPCVTLRFGTDRAESVLAGANVLAPPVDSDFVVAVIEAAMATPQMREVDNLYGVDVSARIVDGVLARLVPGHGLFRSDQRRLRLDVGDCLDNAAVRRLLAFGARSALPSGGFGWLTADGGIDADQGQLTWINCRMTYAFALATLHGFGDHTALVRHGVDYLSEALRDPDHGGWWSGTTDHAGKTAYEHAFVLLAASAAARVTGEDALLRDICSVIDQHFWDADAGAARESFSADWRSQEDYRGANANMHLVEAFLATAVATGDDRWVRRAVSITRKLVHEIGAAADYRLPEHFDSDWRPDPDYNRDRPDDQFRPYGVTVGHLFEWARLCVQVSVAADPAEGEWLLHDAERLFAVARDVGEDVDGHPGFVYTVTPDGKPVVRGRLHWVVAEAIGAAALLAKVTGNASYGEAEQRLVDYAGRSFLDPRSGSWHHELGPTGRPSATIWSGQPDIYHVLQAALLRREPPRSSLVI